MDIMDPECSRLMVDALGELSEMQLTIAYLQIEKGMDVSEIAGELQLPLEEVEMEDFLARQRVISYLSARGVSLGDIPDEELSGAVMQ